jgi:hypothetical protein
MIPVTCPRRGLVGAEDEDGRCRYPLRLDPGAPPYCPVHGLDLDPDLDDPPDPDLIVIGA